MKTMENPEEILHSLEEFSKTKPKDIPRELEEYLCFVAKTGDPVYQWSAVRSLFREKMMKVFTEFYEACPSIEIPPCPNVDLFNYDVMKNFILEKLDTFTAAPFTVQRICELLTTPRKEYNRIDKYMRALEKNILVVSTTEPGGRRTTENGEGLANGLESEHAPEPSSGEINVEETDDAPSWPRLLQNDTDTYQDSSVSDSKTDAACASSSQDPTPRTEEPYVSIEPVDDACARQESDDVSVTITAIPAGVQKRRTSIEPVCSSEGGEDVTESGVTDNSDKSEESPDDLPQTSDTSSSQEIEDADSSSNHSQEEPITDKVPDTSSEDSSSGEAISQNELSSTEDEEKASGSEAAVEDKPEENKEEGSEETAVDTTKCSEVSSPLNEIKDKAAIEEMEISSSEKIDIDSSEAEAKSDENSVEVDSSKKECDDVESQSSEAVQSEKVEEGVEEKGELMEVDEDINSEKVEDTVREEAVSDSSS